MQENQLKVGAIFPQIDLGPNPQTIRDYCAGVEGTGFNHITCFDQVVGLDMTVRPGLPFVHDCNDLFHEIFVLFGFMAAITERIELATGVVVLPQRQTALVAKQAAEVDVLANGRFRLGIGVGIKPDEFGALGQEFRNRGKRIEEQMDLMRALWCDPLIDFEGKWHNIKAGGINPLPVQQPIPIWIGGHSDPVLSRIARKADGWMPNFEPDNFGRQTIEKLKTQCDQLGRDFTEIGIEVTVNVLSKSRQQWIDEAHAWKALGATHLSANTMREVWSEELMMWSKDRANPLTEVSAHLEALTDYFEAVSGI